jgi:hypothetical protein
VCQLAQITARNRTTVRPCFWRAVGCMPPTQLQMCNVRICVGLQLQLGMCIWLADMINCKICVSNAAVLWVQQLWRDVFVDKSLQCVQLLWRCGRTDRVGDTT